jgi:hypothetical protein
VDDAPVLNRIKLVLNYMSRIRGGKNVSPVVIRVAMEMLDELREVPPPILEFYTKQVAAMLFWVSSGEDNPDMPLPEDFEH